MVPKGLRVVVIAGSAALSLAVAQAFAQDPESSPSASRNSAAILDSIARDLGLNLLGPLEEPTVRVPLKAADFSLLGRMQPYAALTARTIKPDLLDATGVTAPAHESRIDDLSNGVGVGGGLNWRLSDRLDVFGEYLFVPRARTGSAGAPASRRDADPPELRGGVSVRF